MPTATHAPSTWSRKEDRVNVTYELPCRVHVAELYPVQAPNGSSIIVYGHDHGLTCLWKGGRTYKKPANNSYEQQRPASTTEVNKDDDMIVIEEDDEGDGEAAPSSQASARQNCLEIEEEELDILHPYDTILDVLEIPLGTAVLGIAFSPLSQHVIAQASGFFPTVLLQKIVIAVACEDTSIRIITLPLSPSETVRTNKQLWSVAQTGVQDILVDGPASSGCRIPLGLSLTWTGRASTSSGIARGASGHDRFKNHKRWKFLLAYHHVGRTGLLKMFEISLNEDGTQFHKKSLELLHLEPLSASTRSLSFSPSVYPSDRHTQLLVSDTTGSVRIYSLSLHGNQHDHHERHPTNSSDTPSFHSKGSWLISLYAPYDLDYSSKTSLQGENRIGLLDARWVFGGKGVVVLLADGQWGIWDVGGISPAPRSSTIGGERASGSLSLSGGSITGFAVRSHVNGSEAAVRMGSAREVAETPKLSDGSKLAPMTPKTRKARQETLFTTSAHGKHPYTGHVTGGISLLSSVNEAFGHGSDESLLIWYNSNVYSVPSLISYWQDAFRLNAQSSDRSQSHEQLETCFGPPVAQFLTPSTGGEIITKVSQARHRSASSSPPSQILRNDVLVCAEHRFIVSSAVKSRKDSANDHDSSFTIPGILLGKDIGQGSGSLLHEDLDLGNMDRALDEMSRKSHGDGRRVDFSFHR